MDATVQFRSIVPGDGPALRALIEGNPSTAPTSFAYDYLSDVVAVHRAFSTELHGVVAESGASLIGMAFGDLHRVQWEGHISQALYVSNLTVDRRYRRRGVARGMADYGIGVVDKAWGSDALLYAAVTEGNISMGLIGAYSFVATRSIQGGVVPMLRSAPKLQPELEVREARHPDLEAIAQGMNHFYREHNLWSPVSPAVLGDFLNVEVAGVHPNRLYVVTRDGQIAGGLSLSDRTRLVRMRVANLSAIARLLGSALGILPRNGVLCALTVRRVWFADGELDSARYLWQRLRYTLCEQGNCMGIAYDPRDRLADVYQVPFWLPMFGARYVVRASRGPDPERPIYCHAGP